MLTKHFRWELFEDSVIPDLKYLYCDIYILMNYLFNPYMSKKSYFWGSLFFFIVFQLFVRWTFFFKYTLLVWNLTKDFFFEYRKYFIRQRWLPVTEGHLTPTSPEAFPHNASLYVIIYYPDRWRYYLVTW
jgi:hypothetical protein